MPLVATKPLGGVMLSGSGGVAKQAEHGGSFMAAATHILGLTQGWSGISGSTLTYLYYYIYSMVWCGREDSNFHGLSPTTTSTLRVYQFRHDRTS
jgi:hypothetical protein